MSDTVRVTQAASTSSPDIIVVPRINPTARQNNVIVRQNTVQARRSAIERLVLILKLILAFVQFTAIVVVMGIVLSKSTDISRWGLCGICLSMYAFMLIPRVVLLVYFYRHPLELDAFNEMVPPVSMTGKAMIRLRSLVAFVMLWLNFMIIVGAFDETARDNVPAIYWTSVGIVIFNISILLLPFFGIILLICCLPFVISLLSWLYPEPNRGASNEAINKIPRFEFKTGQTQYGEIIIPTEDVTCSICLQPYENGQNIRIIKCKHHFHERCVDEWLKLQATCPLCVRPATDEGQVGDDDDDKV